MKTVYICLLLGSFCFLQTITNALADCADPPKDSEEGDVKTWFKNLGCKIQEGAKDVGEAAKPWADKIGTSAKDFGSTVAKKYDEIKHKLTDENANPSSSPSPIYNAPTEKVPLAPLGGDISGIQSPQMNPAYTISDTTPFPSDSETPQSIDDRFLLQPSNECPPGQQKDHRMHCRPTI